MRAWGPEGRRVILAVSFGTTYQETLEFTIAATERRLAESFPGWEVRRAFTASTIVRILRKRGVQVDGVSEALEKLVALGTSDLVVQPLHLIPGEEYHMLLRALAPYRSAFRRIAVGEPLFAGTDTYQEAVDAVLGSVPAPGPGEALVFMGHGSSHAANAAYALIQLLLERRGPGIFVGTVEGYPDLDWVIEKLEAGKFRRAILYPLMLVAGDHAHNDMAGDGEDSWKTILGSRGISALPVLRGLGEVRQIQDLYVARARAAVSALGETGRVEQ